MIARYHEDRQVGSKPVNEGVRCLEFAVPGSLAKVAGDGAGICPKRGQKGFQRLDLRQVGVPSKVEIGEVRQKDRRAAHPYQTTRTRYVSTTSPRAGARTRNRVRVEESFSAGTELDTMIHSPPRCSSTSIVAAESPAFRRVTR